MGGAFGGEGFLAMFESLSRDTGLSENDIETSLFEIADQEATEDHSVIEKAFLATLNSEDFDSDLLGLFREEISIFLKGCGSLDDSQRSVRARKGEGEGGKAGSADKRSSKSKKAGKGAEDEGVEDVLKKRKKTVSKSNSDGKQSADNEKDEEKEGDEVVANQTKKNKSKKQKKDKLGGVAANMESGEDGSSFKEHEEGVIDTEQMAQEKLDEMRVSLESDACNNAEEGEKAKIVKPKTVRDVLTDLKINKQMMTHCISAEMCLERVNQSEVLDQKNNYWCFVSKMDPKGSTPQEILDVIYALDMAQRFYKHQRPPASARGGGNELFDIPKAAHFGATSVKRHGETYHKYYEDDEAKTVPLFKMKMFIEQANTGGERPLVMFFMFLVVETPITMDFIDTVYRSCTKNSMGREKFVCEDLKNIWVNIAHRHQTFSGNGKKSLESMMQISFSDLFDPDSSNCFSKIFRIPRCIQQARLHMHMWVVDNVTGRSHIPVDMANVMVNIRFNKIDAVFDGNCPAMAADSVFVNVSNLCCAAYADEYENYKDQMRVYKAAVRRKGAAPADNNAQEEDAQDEEALEMPVFNPPPIWSFPTYIDWSCEHTTELMLYLTLQDNVGCAAEAVRMLHEHHRNYPDTIKMQGFPITNMVAYVDPTMLLPHTGTMVGMTEWLVENKECALPDQMTMLILMMMHQGKLSNSSIMPVCAVTQEGLARNILTLSDLRTSFLSGDTNLRKMMYRRATPVRDKQMRSIKMNENKTQRCYAFMQFLLGTAYPLAFANARSDTGTYGGRDAAASVFNEIGEYQNTGSDYQSCISEGFHIAHAILMKNDTSRKWALKEYKGTLYNTIHLMKASFDFMNDNYRLKPNNLQFLFRLFTSDMGLRLTYQVNSIGSAVNGIGNTLKISDFNACKLRKSKRCKTPFETKNAKSWGTGADCTMAKFIEAISPENNGCPASISHANCGKPSDWRTTTEAGTWYIIASFINTLHIY